MNSAVKAKLPTETATITIAVVKEKKEGQFSASIKDTDGLWYWIKPSDLQFFKIGEQYEVVLTVSQSNGFTNRNIEHNGIRHLTPYGHQASGSSEDHAAQKVAQAAQQARPQVVREAAPRAKAKDPTPCRIYCCGGLNAAISSHQVNVRNVEDIIEVTNNLRAAWDATFGADDVA